MENDVVIQVDGLYKKFTKSLKRSVLYGSIDLARNLIGIPTDQSKLRKAEFWALEDINFKLHQGEILGIIGINGSGKSTLLRLLTGIFPPDRGKIVTKGNIGGLIAVGAGFHPHMTGRENIYLNGTILGMSKSEIDENFDKIISFAEIGDFIDAPVSTYSSGMKVRLGFSIAIHVKPEILLIDEVLSVGDISFRNKSLRKMASLREEAKAIIYISHNLEQVRQLCTRVIVLNKGKIEFNGDVQEGLVFYEELTRKIRHDNFNLENEGKLNSKFKKGISSGEEIDILDVGIQKDGDKVDSIEFRQSLHAFCDFHVRKPIDSLYFTVSLHSDQAQNIIWKISNDNNEKFKVDTVSPGKYRLNFDLPNPHLNPGVYKLFIAIRNDETGETYERFFDDSSFIVKSDGTTLERGYIDTKAHWNLKEVS